MTSPTLKEMAVQFAIDMGYPVDTGENNRCVNRYLAGAKVALEMAAKAQCAACATGEKIVPAGDPSKMDGYHVITLSGGTSYARCLSETTRALIPE